MTSRCVAVAVVVAAAAVSCGSDGTLVPSASSTTSTSTSSTTTDSGTASTSTTTSLPATTSTFPESIEPVPEAELPGVAFDLAPTAGQELAVIGVRHDDVLNVRRMPGTVNPVVAELANLADGFAATSRARMLSESIWWEVVTAQGVVGWVNARFTGVVGPTFDVTSQVIGDLGERPSADTMEQLGLTVAESFLGDPETNPRVVLVVAASEGDLGEVTYDVVGLADDATAALRLHVFGEPTGSAFSLRTVELTDMCDSVRGRSEPDGLCA